MRQRNIGWRLDYIAAHRALGYEEVERIVCFRRPLRETPSR
jgi:exonuclease III